MTQKEKSKAYGWISAGLFAIALILAFCIGFDEEMLLGAFQMSMIAAAVINGSFGLFAGFFAWFWRWLDGQDSNELSHLFGVKTGLAVFCLLMLVSFGLREFKKPPCYAPGTLVLIPLHGFEIASVIFEPIYWIYEGTKAFGKYREKKRKERARDWIDRSRRE